MSRHCGETYGRNIFLRKDETRVRSNSGANDIGANGLSAVEKELHEICEDLTILRHAFGHIANVERTNRKIKLPELNSFSGSRNSKDVENFMSDM